MPLSSEILCRHLQQALPDAAPAAALALAEQLAAAYRQAQRHYHTLQHLAECLAGYAAVQAQLVQPGTVLLALLFHDAVYQPHQPDNEARSAEWAAEALARLGAGPAQVLAVQQMIMATQSHHASDADTQLLLDIDLSILGASPARFAEYNQQIRAEYAFVAEADYALARSRIMRSFAARQPLFHSKYFQQRLAGAARQNLAEWQ